MRRPASLLRPAPGTFRLRLLAFLLWCGAAASGAGLLLGWLGPRGLESFDGWRFFWGHAAFMAIVFRFHLFLGLVVCAAGVGWLAFGRGKAAAVTMAGSVFIPVIAAWWPAPRVNDGRPSILFMSANLLYSHADLATIRRQIEEHKPDVVLFQEYTPDAQAALGKWLRGVYPHHVEYPQAHAFGQAVYSKLVLDEPPRLFLPGIRLSQITVRVSWGGEPLSVTNVHLVPPVLSQVNEHRAQARLLGDWLGARAAVGDVVAAGDWNATWHTPHMACLARAGFNESHEKSGAGRGSTWPRTGVLAFVPGIRLDHVVYSAGLECVEAWVGEDVDSDHAPVFARLARRSIVAR